MEDGLQLRRMTEWGGQETREEAGAVVLAQEGEGAWGRNGWNGGSGAERLGKTSERVRR